MVPRQLWRLSFGLLLEVKFGKWAYLHVPDVISRWHGGLAHLLDRAHVIHIYNMFALLCIHSNYRFTVITVGLAAIQI